MARAPARKADSRPGHLAGGQPGLKESYTAEEVRQLMASVPAARPRKYRNKPASVDGITFPSQKEARRYLELKLLERAGRIDKLRCHVRWPLVVNGVTIGAYVSDFEYDECGEHVVEDTKGVRTRVYGIKKRLMLALHGIKIREL